jgi:hypothetical protein
MPGQLKPDAECPVCENPLLMITDTSNEDGVTREYFHSKPTPKTRRHRPCRQYFASHVKAQAERNILEGRPQP